MKILFVIASDRFMDSGYIAPREILEENGIQCITASIIHGTCYGIHGEIVESDLSLDEVEPGDYDGVIITGGIGCQDQLWRNEKLIDIVNKIGTAGKLTAAICLGVPIIGEAGLLAGKKVACLGSPASKRLLTLDKAEIMDAKVVVDGKIVTAKLPSDADEFAHAILSVIS